MTPAVELAGVRKVFRHRPVLFNWLGRERGGETVALDDASLACGRGEVLVLLGPNGSGKTTILKLLSTLLLPDSGRVTVAGCDTQSDADAVCRQVAFAVAHERSFFNRLTARENLEFFAALEEIPRRERTARVEECLAAAELTAAADTLVMKFSSGMFQELGIARALLKRPAVLLLDEPSRSLDPGATERVWEQVRQAATQGASVVLATHNFEEAAAVADTVALLRLGKLVAQRKVHAATSIGELRRFYFEQVAPEQASAARGGRA